MDRFKPIFPVLVALTAIIAVWLPGCGKESPSSPPEEEVTFQSVMTNGGVCPVPVASVEETDLGNVAENRDDGTYWDCVVTTYDVAKVPDEFQTFDPSTDIIYPGSLLQGGTLENNPPDPIITRRSGGTVFITIVNGSQGVSVDVPEVKGSTIFQAMNTIIQDNSGVIPANFKYHMTEVFSEEQIALAMNVSVKTFSSKFSGELKFKRDVSYHSYLITLDQMMYTMNYDLPTSYSSVFAPDVTPKDLLPYIGPGNPATYISQVAFGRRFYMMVQSTSLRNEVEASIKASFNYATKVTASVSGTYINNLENKEINAFAQGGDASLALGAVLGGADELRAFLTEGGSILTGVPLSYRVRNLLGGTEVKVKVTGKYDVKNCVLETYTIPDSVKILWYRADTLVTMDGSNVVSRWGDAFGRGNDAIRFGSQERLNPVLHDTDGVKSINFPINIRQWTIRATINQDCWWHDGWYYHSEQDLPGKNGEGLEFDGGAFVNSSYTLMAVVQMEQGYFLTGSAKPSLTMGYGTANLWSFNHQRPFDNADQYDLSVSLSNPTRQFQLLTMIYDIRDESMRVYINGLQRGETVKEKPPLDGFPDATLGAWSPKASSSPCGPPYRAMDVEPVNIAEIVAFKKALTSEQRKLWEDALKDKYGLPSF